MGEEEIQEQELNVLLKKYEGVLQTLGQTKLTEHTYRVKVEEEMLAHKIIIRQHQW